MNAVLDIAPTTVDDLYPLRSLPWCSGVTGGTGQIEKGPFGEPDDFHEIALLLRTCGV